jgi:hypothetical protein
MILQFHTPQLLATNFCVNPSFEAGSSGWNRWVANLAVDDSWADSGEQSLKITPDGSGSNVPYAGYEFPASPNRWYGLSVVMRLAAPYASNGVSTAARMVLVRAFTPDNTLINLSPPAISVVPNTAGAYPYSVICQLPASAVRFSFRFLNGSPSPDDLLWIDSTLIVDGDTQAEVEAKLAYGYFDGDHRPDGYLSTWQSTPNASASDLLLPHTPIDLHVLDWTQLERQPYTVWENTTDPVTFKTPPGPRTWRIRALAPADTPDLLEGTEVTVADTLPGAPFDAVCTRYSLGSERTVKGRPARTLATIELTEVL